MKKHSAKAASARKALAPRLKSHPRALTIKEIAALPDSAIDTSDIPELDAAFWAKAKLIEPDRTRLVTLRIKQSVIEAFRRERPKGYQTRMNAVLESYVLATQKPR